MQTTRFVQYLEAEVLGADPVKLVNLLYSGAIEAAGAARRYLAKGDIARRSRQINRVWGILFELLQSLDRERGGEIATQLAALYIYMQQRLMEANMRQTDAPLAEVESLLGTLAEAWRSVPAPAPAPAAATGIGAGTRAQTGATPDSPYQPVSCSY
jgi:flagellar protein FliS